LIAFNVGVELGQLAVIVMAFALTGLWFRAQPWYRARIVMPASAAIAVIGLFWTVQRVLEG
ncbi:MAG: HupE/UreJ family protein, partial [Pseudomonadota bacterium]|nr:HupE/UreJ family protein [Pseudomonadota bacterium]